MSYGCVICSEVFSSTDGVNNYPVCIKGCGHSFHKACLRQWLEKSKTCPVCRTPTCDSASCIFRLHLMSVSNFDGSFLSTTMKDEESKDLRKEVEELRRFKEKIMTYVTDLKSNIGQMNRNMSHIEIELGITTGSKNDSVIDLSEDTPARVSTPPVVVPKAVPRAISANAGALALAISRGQFARRGRSNSSAGVYPETSTRGRSNSSAVAYPEMSARDRCVIYRAAQ